MNTPRCNQQRGEYFKHSAVHCFPVQARDISLTRCAYTILWLAQTSVLCYPEYKDHKLSVGSSCGLLLDTGLVLLQNILPAKTYNAAKTLTLTAGVVGLGIVMVLLTGYVMASPTFGWTGNAQSFLHAEPLCSMCFHQPHM